MSERSDSRVTRRRFLQQGLTVAASGALVGTATAGLGDDTKRDMKYRRLGRTGLMVSEIGLGCPTGLRSRQLGPERFHRYREQLPTIVDVLLVRGRNFVATPVVWMGGDTGRLLRLAEQEGRYVIRAGAQRHRCPTRRFPAAGGP